MVAIQNRLSERTTLCFLLLAAFCPSIFVNYLWSDDYPIFVDHGSFSKHQLLDLRPIYALSIELVFKVFGDYSTPILLRLLGLIGLMFLACSVFEFLKDNENNALLIAVIFFAFCTFPWANIIYWATTFVIPWASLFSLIGVRLLLQKRKRLLGTILILVSFLIYPPATFFPLPVIYYRFLQIGSSPKLLFKIILGLWSKVIAIGSVTLIGYSSFIGFASSNEINDRVGIVKIQDFPDKTVFFATRLLGQSIRFFNLETSSTIKFICEFVLVILIVGTYFTVTSGRRFTFQHFGVLLLVLVLSLSPFILASDNQVEIRYFLSTNWLVAVLSIKGLIAFVSSLMQRSRSSEVTLKVIDKVAKFTVAVAAIVSSLLFFSSVVNPVTSNTRHFIFEQFVDNGIENCRKDVYIIARSDPWPTRQLLGMAAQTTDLSSTWVPVPAFEYYSSAFGIYESTRFVLVNHTETSRGECQIRLNEFN